MGEPAGIGPDIILLAFDALLRAPEAPSMVAFGDPQLFASRAKRLGLSLAVTGIDDPREARAHAAELKVVACANADDRPGKLDPATGSQTVAALQAALDAVRSGACRALVTAPIHKANLYATGFAFPGHTEMLEAYAREHWPEQNPHAVMMLAGPELRTVPVTLHIPLNAVGPELTSERIITLASYTARDLKARFGITSPRLAIAGLNPHAGEDGAMGREDQDIIAPSVEALQTEGLLVEGPLPADTMFHADARARYDAALCMYHDQALIPVKTLDFHNTVNVTLGLPFVRTSPDHGTALSLAGSGKASPASMLAAIAMAAQMSTAQRQAA